MAGGDENLQPVATPSAPHRSAAQRVELVSSVKKLGPPLIPEEQDALCEAMSQGLKVDSAKNFPDGNGGTTPGKQNRPAKTALIPAASSSRGGGRGRNPDTAGPPSGASSKALPEQQHLQPPWSGFSTRLASGSRPVAASSGSQQQMGSVKLLTPVRASKALKETLGSSQVLTPVRRSARKFGARAEAGTEALLEATNYSYTPNKALLETGTEDLLSASGFSNSPVTPSMALEPGAEDVA